jgi:hypothetical protein
MGPNRRNEVHVDLSAASGSRAASVLPLYGLCPTSPEITDYDKKNYRLYTWLLIQEEDGATIEELASGILGFDLSKDRDWALRVTRSHLVRARWLHNLIWPCID